MCCYKYHPAWRQLKKDSTWSAFTGMNSKILRLTFLFRGFWGGFFVLFCFFKYYYEYGSTTKKTPSMRAAWTSACRKGLSQCCSWSRNTSLLYLGFLWVCLFVYLFVLISVLFFNISIPVIFVFLFGWLVSAANYVGSQTVRNWIVG